MSPPDSPAVTKRRRNALSECIPETSASPVPPHSTRTPPPQSLQARLRPTLIKPLPNLSGEVVVLPGLKSRAFSLILDYMYTSELQINKENVQDLLFVSCLLQIKTIVDACVKILTKESKWKISTSSFRFNKKPPVTSSTTFPPRINSGSPNKSDTLPASPLRNSNVSCLRSIATSYSHEERENLSEKTKVKKETVIQQNAEPHQERMASVIPAHMRPRDRIDDVKQLENQPQSGTNKLVGPSTANANNATAQQFYSHSDNQQLSTLPKVVGSVTNSGLMKEKPKISDDFSAKSEFRDLKRKYDVSFRRNRTMSDSFHSTQDGALDLRRKQKPKQSLSDDEGRKVTHQPSSYHDAVNHKDNLKSLTEVKCSSQIVTKTTSCFEPPKSQTIRPHNPSGLHTQNHSENPVFLKCPTVSQIQQHALACLDLSRPTLNFPSFHGFPSPLPSQHSLKSLDLNSHQVPVSDEALKQFGFFTNVTPQASNLLWQDPVKLLTLDGVAAFRDPPLSTFEALQIQSWPSYFERYNPVFNPEALLSRTSSNNLMPPKFEKVDSQALSFHAQTLGGSNQSHEKCSSSSPDESTKRSSSQLQASYEPSKHPLKRKLMMSANVNGSDSFRANSIEGEPPPKSSLKSMSPTISRFEPLRAPEPAGPTTRPQQCVM